MSDDPHTRDSWSSLKTIQVNREDNSKPTVRVAYPQGSPLSVSTDTLVNARKGGRSSAFKECRRTCRLFYLSWRRGVLTGFGVSTLAYAIALVIEYFRRRRH